MTNCEFCGKLSHLGMFCSLSCQAAHEAVETMKATHCRYCSTVLPTKEADKGGRERQFCSAICRNRHRRGSKLGVLSERSEATPKPEYVAVVKAPPNLGLLRASLEEVLNQLRQHVHTAGGAVTRHEWATELRRIADALD